jgi:endonuclease-3
MGMKPRNVKANGRAPEPERVRDVLELLQKTWGHAVCELDFKSPFQLLCATILSAQSTDKRVNMVTPALFARYPTAAEMAKAEPEELEPIIHSTGFFRQKARSLVGMARKLCSDYGGEVPKTLEELITLPGVARKTANVVLGTAYGIPSGVVVDTHVKRLANRLGFTIEEDPEKIERDLQAAIPKERWIDFAHQLIWHGRRTCQARKPLCETCPLAPLCPGRLVA